MAPKGKAKTRAKLKSKPAGAKSPPPKKPDREPPPKAKAKAKSGGSRTGRGRGRGRGMKTARSSPRKRRRGNLGRSLAEGEWVDFHTFPAATSADVAVGSLLQAELRGPDGQVHGSFAVRVEGDRGGDGRGRFLEVSALGANKEKISDWTHAAFGGADEQRWLLHLCCADSGTPCSATLSERPAVHVMRGRLRPRVSAFGARARELGSSCAAPPDRLYGLPDPASGHAIFHGDAHGARVDPADSGARHSSLPGPSSGAGGGIALAPGADASMVRVADLAASLGVGVPGGRAATDQAAADTSIDGAPLSAAEVEAISRADAPGGSHVVEPAPRIGATPEEKKHFYKQRLEELRTHYRQDQQGEPAALDRAGDTGRGVKRPTVGEELARRARSSSGHNQSGGGDETPQPTRTSQPPKRRGRSRERRRRRRRRSKSSSPRSSTSSTSSRRDFRSAPGAGRGTNPFQ